MHTILPPQKNKIPYDTIILTLNDDIRYYMIIIVFGEFLLLKNEHSHILLVTLIE